MCCDVNYSQVYLKELKTHLDILMDVLLHSDSYAARTLMGKLAEKHEYLFILLPAEADKKIDHVIWRNNEDNMPDFGLGFRLEDFSTETKVANAHMTKKDKLLKVDISKTRDDKKNKGIKRLIRADAYDILSVCLFNYTNEWEFRYACTPDLRRHHVHKDYLTEIHHLPLSPNHMWFDDITKALTRSWELRHGLITPSSPIIPSGGNIAPGKKKTKYVPIFEKWYCSAERIKPVRKKRGKAAKPELLLPPSVSPA